MDQPQLLLGNGTKSARRAHRVYLRDNYTCQLCGSKLNLTKHRLIPQSVLLSNPQALNNCATLCRSCHNWADQHFLVARLILMPKIDANIGWLDFIMGQVIDYVKKNQLEEIENFGVLDGTYW